MGAYEDALKKLEISEDTFNEILEDENARKKIIACLMRCLKTKYRDIASVLLQGIAIKKSQYNEDVKNHRNGDIIESRSDEFVESDHPRDKDGKFTSGNGESGGANPPVEPPNNKNPYFDPKDPPNMYGHDRTHEKYWRWEIDNGLSSGALSKSVNVDAQKKHREGTKEYKDALANGQHKSILTVSGSAVKKLISMYSGKGKARALNGVPREGFKHNEKIGYYVSADGSQKIPTDCGTIHYSKKGAHIVPDYPSDDFYEKWKKGEVK